LHDNLFFTVLIFMEPVREKEFFGPKGQDQN